MNVQLYRLLKLRKLSAVLLVIIPVFFAVFLRIQPIYLSGTEGIAENAVEDAIKNAIIAEVYSNNPTLPDERKLLLIEKKLAEHKKTNSELINKEIIKLSNQLKDKFRDALGYSYLIEVDPYYHARLVRNLLTTGYIADEKREGIVYNNHQLAPVGKLSDPNPHVYIGAFAFKIVSLFNSQLPLAIVLSYIPVILSALAVVAAFFVGKLLKNNIAGFFSAIIIAIHPKLLNRTLGGFFDTDPYNILMPLLIAVCLILLFLQPSFLRKLFFVLLLGTLLGFYSALWSGWIFIFHVLWFSFVFAAGFHVFLRGYSKIKKRGYAIPAIKSYAALFFSFLVSSVVSIAFFDFLMVGGLRFHKIYDIFHGVVVFLSIKGGSSASELLWPNILSTVSELRNFTFTDIIYMLGGFALFFIFLAGFIILLAKLFKQRRMVLLFFFLFWVFLTIYGITKGIRFIFLFATPFSIVISYFFAEFIGIFVKMPSKIIKPGFVKYIIQPSAFGLCIALLFLNTPIGTPLFSSALAVSDTLPLINDEWVSALDFIRENTNSTAIITSWWDFGHWFEFFADRSVTFDGASQHLPVSYWVGRFFLSANEVEAVGILRMLDCGSNTAFDNVFSWSNSFLQSIQVLNNAVLMNRQKANEYYSTLFDKEESDKLLSLTHCNPPEAIVVASEDMAGKAVAWGIGNWNFTRAFMSRQAGKPKQEFIAIAESAGVTSEAAAKSYKLVNMLSQEEIRSWISKPLIFNSRFPEPCIENAGTISCKSNILEGNINVLIDKKTLSVKILFKNSVLIPKKLVYFNGNLTTVNFENATFDYALILLEDSGKYRLQIASVDLADSLFVKLLYFNGKGLDYFEPFYSSKTFNGEAIKLYKMRWQD